MLNSQKRQRRVFLRNPEAWRFTKQAFAMVNILPNLTFLVFVLNDSGYFYA